MSKFMEVYKPVKELFGFGDDSPEKIERKKVASKAKKAISTAIPSKITFNGTTVGRIKCFWGASASSQDNFHELTGAYTTQFIDCEIDFFELTMCIFPSGNQFYNTFPLPEKLRTMWEKEHRKWTQAEFDKASKEDERKFMTQVINPIISKANTALKTKGYKIETMVLNTKSYHSKGNLLIYLQKQGSGSTPKSFKEDHSLDNHRGV